MRVNQGFEIDRYILIVALSFCAPDKTNTHVKCIHLLVPKGPENVLYVAKCDLDDVVGQIVF